MTDKAHLRVEQLVRAHTGNGQRLRLKIIVFQYQATDIVSHAGEELIAILGSQLARIDDSTNQNLDVDLVIRTIDTGRIVDGIGVDAATRQRIFDAAQLRATEIAALCHHLAA